MSRRSRINARSILKWLAWTWVLPGLITLVAFLRLAANDSSACGEPTCQIAQTWLLFMLWFSGLAAFFVVGLVGTLVIAMDRGMSVRLTGVLPSSALRADQKNRGLGELIGRSVETGDLRLVQCDGWRCQEVVKLRTGGGRS